MKVFKKGKDGGPDSTVYGYWLIELKKLFSIVLLCFEGESRDAYHSHAFNSLSWLISGHLDEEFRDGTGHCIAPSWKPVITKRETFHKVSSIGQSWVLSFRGPWVKIWHEFVNGNAD